MTDQQKQVYSLILKKDIMTVNAIAKVLKIPEEEVQTAADFLVERQLIRNRLIQDFQSGRMVKAYRSPLADDDLIVS